MDRITQTTQTVLGFDVGTRRTGIAVGQTLTGTATALTTLKSAGQEQDWSGIGALIAAWRPDILVVGDPAGAGQPSPLSILIERFRADLQARFGLPVYPMDESYTSREAYHRLKSERSSGRRKRIDRREIDSLAAAIMLEGWLAQYAQTVQRGGQY